MNVVYSMTKMRYKQGKGDPVGFKQFMRQENIKPGTIVRYVGNRLISSCWHLLLSSRQAATLPQVHLQQQNVTKDSTEEGP